MDVVMIPAPKPHPSLRKDTNFMGTKRWNWEPYSWSKYMKDDYLASWWKTSPDSFLTYHKSCNGVGADMIANLKNDSLSSYKRIGKAIPKSQR